MSSSASSENVSSDQIFAEKSVRPKPCVIKLVGSMSIVFDVFKFFKIFFFGLSVKTNLFIFSVRAFVVKSINFLRLSFLTFKYYSIGSRSTNGTFFSVFLDILIF